MHKAAAAEKEAMQAGFDLQGVREALAAKVGDQRSE